MKQALTTFTLIFLALPLMAEPVRFEGTLGPYAIEAELDYDSMHNIQGRYRYVGRDDWLSLTGRPYGTQVLDLTESFEGTESGQLLLEVDGQGQGLRGYWIGVHRDYPVTLATKGDVTEVFPIPASVEPSSAITGQYAVHSYWVNDWFAPSYEVGFNGGDVNVVEISDKQIFVQFTFTVGPTYHIASFMGLATREAEGFYVHDDELRDGTDRCRLEFMFDETGLAISDVGNGFACQFGARAHANFDLQKVGDIAEFGGTW